MVDVYTEWSGPCTAMQDTLKRAKLEVSVSILILMMARVEICHDRRDRRSCKICVTCVIFFQKTTQFLTYFASLHTEFTHFVQI